MTLFVVLFCFIAYFGGILEARNEEFASHLRQSECIISCFHSWKSPYDLVFLNTSATEKINDPFQAPDEEPLNMCNATAEMLSCLKSSCELGVLQYEALSLLTGIHLTYCRSGSDHALAEGGF
ncbi:hypothetical protein Ddc_16018 [Ditylenchus destructor]|nr:hypothetical protein Ddc_16018 [Ditylenchus destructor]